MRYSKNRTALAEALIDKLLEREFYLMSGPNKQSDEFRQYPIVVHEYTMQVRFQSQEHH